MIHTNTHQTTLLAVKTIHTTTQPVTVATFQAPAVLTTHTMAQPLVTKLARH